MEKRATIKDIAKLAGVSTWSVHCALLEKKGIGEQTRRHILDIAKRLNYCPNSSAAALKRKQFRIAAAFPDIKDDDRFYYTGIWQGVRDYFETVRDWNIVCIEIPYKNRTGSRAGSAGLIDELSDHPSMKEINGLLTVGYLDRRGEISIQSFIERNVPVVLVTNDIPLSGRLCCVQPEYHSTGRMVAEYITRQIPRNSGILLWAGDEQSPSQSAIVKGFYSYLKDRGFDNPVYKLYSSWIKKTDQENMSRALMRKKPAACFCVNARGSVLMGMAIMEMALSEKIIAVGSDIFRENLDYLKGGVFTNLLHKNTYVQAYVAAKSLVNFLLKDISPSGEIINVGSELVFQSNAFMFKNGFSQLLL
jgi:LacI family transcriptional regulator